MIREPHSNLAESQMLSASGEGILNQSSHVIYRQVFKRVFDFVFALAGIIVLAIPMLIVALLVKVTSKGPVLFCQVRYGRDSVPFTMLKFRSMYVDAPVKANKDFTTQSMDHYVTPLGRFMRKSSVDELPQLFNVLVGQMSLIGPRPMAKTDELVLNLRKKSGADQVRPGITGLAQINGRNELSDEDKAHYDGIYAAKYSLVYDVKIFLDSIIVVVAQRGINHKKNEG